MVITSVITLNVKGTNKSYAAEQKNFALKLTIKGTYLINLNWQANRDTVEDTPVSFCGGIA
jgi:hypothetical protein